ncbi:low molecular weight protein-tyrosine-phosphatase [Mesorhizobium erdmanii]|uniref:protein-tyrosine-phosphatase n=1 Tax=Mesorhizobium erdmanii TaxID=1777866 RepID=A0A6M7UCL4_9HYPH|nr:MULTISPECIES: low molecular weight protein-tyrosine-phosphatase [Mesorhizobium]OBQ63410.1 protein tyrosine phosphatase [Mesorhizobium loti]QKC74965.1 low molecular weight phosphotyrosine protein phosphatase [Mesorhizobium erdmanii]
MSIKPINSILFVCLGNICRSPLAEGVFRAVWAERGRGRDMVLDSAATSGWEVGSAPDQRSIAIALRHGIDISGQRARKVRPEDFSRFDLILGMDRSNVADLKTLAPARDRVHLFLEFAHGQARDVPDPYYEDQQAFAEVYRMIREASEALATRLAARASVPDSGQASSTI